jgi:hypothetical protein
VKVFLHIEPVKVEKTPKNLDLVRNLGVLYVGQQWIRELLGENNIGSTSGKSLALMEKHPAIRNEIVASSRLAVKVS